LFRKEPSMRLLPLLLLLALMPIAAGCTTNSHQTLTTTPPVTGGIDPLCGQVRIVELSHADTQLTKTQVIANNEVIAAVCGNR